MVFKSVFIKRKKPSLGAGWFGEMKNIGVLVSLYKIF